LEAKKIWADILLFWWIKATIMKGTQCLNNNITTIVAHPTPGRSKESVTQPEYLVANQQMQNDSYTCPKEKS
jgi:hypothetical protein